ncbi:unnamed protein product [Trichogramma brassicae]|uniref:Uncharacterized protein n=1 Tax=Trichogramma brassicae TaxID=86971 RepID=A0A6H5J370_9HYME|nr:unnamed protein product [Trichogramma brassicae]
MLAYASTHRCIGCIGAASQSSSHLTGWLAKCRGGAAAVPATNFGLILLHDAQSSSDTLYAARLQLDSDIVARAVHHGKFKILKFRSRRWKAEKKSYQKMTSSSSTVQGNFKLFSCCFGAPLRRVTSRQVEKKAASLTKRLNQYPLSRSWRICIFCSRQSIIFLASKFYIRPILRAICEANRLNGKSSKENEQTSWLDKVHFYDSDETHYVVYEKLYAESLSIKVEKIKINNLSFSSIVFSGIHLAERSPGKARRVPRKKFFSPLITHGREMTRGKMKMTRLRGQDVIFIKMHMMFMKQRLVYNRADAYIFVEFECVALLCESFYLRLRISCLEKSQRDKTKIGQLSRWEFRTWKRAGSGAHARYSRLCSEARESCTMFRLISDRTLAPYVIENSAVRRYIHAIYTLNTNFQFSPRRHQSARKSEMPPRGSTHQDRLDMIDLAITTNRASRSSESHVTIRKVDFILSGNFSCEVTTNPSYTTLTSTKGLTVVCESCVSAVVESARSCVCSGRSWCRACGGAVVPTLECIVAERSREVTRRFAKARTEGSQENTLYSDTRPDGPRHLRGGQSRVWTGHEDEAAGGTAEGNIENGVRGIEAKK